MKKNCVRAFKRVGAATKDGVTCACQQDAQVMQSIIDGDKEKVLLHHAVLTANNNAVRYLNQAGYKAQNLQVKLVVKKQEERVTEPNIVVGQLALALQKATVVAFM
jgi:hypothetical protein